MEYKECGKTNNVMGKINNNFNIDDTDQWAYTLKLMMVMMTMDICSCP